MISLVFLALSETVSLVAMETTIVYASVFSEIPRLPAVVLPKNCCLRDLSKFRNLVTSLELTEDILVQQHEVLSIGK